MISGLPPSLTDKAYAELEERIVTLTLRPGQVLSENALAASLNIGRTPLRFLGDNCFLPEEGSESLKSEIDYYEQPNNFLHY
jgi:hypothetical protein